MASPAVLEGAAAVNASTTDLAAAVAALSTAAQKAHDAAVVSQVPCFFLRHLSIGEILSGSYESDQHRQKAILTVYGASLTHGCAHACTHVHAHAW